MLSATAQVQAVYPAAPAADAAGTATCQLIKKTKLLNSIFILKSLNHYPAKSSLPLILLNLLNAQIMKKMLPLLFSLFIYLLQNQGTVNAQCGLTNSIVGTACTGHILTASVSAIPCAIEWQLNGTVVGRRLSATPNQGEFSSNWGMPGLVLNYSTALPATMDAVDQTDETPSRVTEADSVRVLAGVMRHGSVPLLK